MVTSVQVSQAQFSEDMATKEVRGSPRQGSHQLVRGGGGESCCSVVRCPAFVSAFGLRSGQSELGLIPSVIGLVLPRG